MMFDVIVIGGGVIGMTLALGLGQAGLKVGLVEKRDLKYLDNDLDLFEYDTRVFAINLASQAIFKSLDVWQSLSEYRISPYQAMQVWDTKGKGRIEFDTQFLMESELGHIIEQKVLLKALWEKIKLCAEVTLLPIINIHSITFRESLSSLYTGANEPYVRLQAPLIVGADGINSFVRLEAGISVKGWSYHQSALVATLYSEKPHDHIARQRFAPEGPLALLPLNDPYISSMVWSTTPSQATTLKNASPEVFSNILTQAFGDSLGKLTLAKEERALFPLKMQQASQYIQKGCALVGDAAQTLHPLAGLGMNLGLKNVQTLSDLIKGQKQKNRNLADLAYLKRYERREKSRAYLMIALMEGFKRGFGTEQPFIQYIRNVGLNFVNEHSMLKKYFMKRAMGK